ncbi:MAG: response regulator [Sulfurimicrobium sp.]|nr:response regulator [Sulfurimicrobium sp.]MDZ7655950.1 response regulator [Sulfurimicrobium sp.]
MDDEANIISALTRLLRPDGYRVLRALGGREGLEVLAQNSVGVIVSDQRMPEMTGVEFLSNVKELYPDTVRMVLSGYTDLNSVTDAINRGAVFRFFTKPWDDDLLRANIKEAFRYHEMKQENAHLTHELKKANDELMRVNSMLEARVEQKAFESSRNLNILLVTQDILEHLPVGVVGVGDDGVIAIANEMAHTFFGESLLGEQAAEKIPRELLEGEEGVARSARVGTSLEPVFCWRKKLGGSSMAKGSVLVSISCPRENCDA